MIIPIEFNTFLENIKMMNVVFNCIFGLAFQSKSNYIVKNGTYHLFMQLCIYSANRCFVHLFET